MSTRPRPFRRRRHTDERGTALLEFALVLPLIAVLVFGTVDLGRAYRLQTRLENAAREGGRFVQTAPEQVVPGVSCGDPANVTWVVNHESGVNSYTVTVDKVSGSVVPTVPTSLLPASTTTTVMVPTTVVHLTSCKTLQDATSLVSPGDRVRVTVSSPFTVLTPLVSAFVGNPITISGVQEVVVQGL